MTTPQLHRQLLDQLSQWIIPKDQRHLKNCAESVAAILQSDCTGKGFLHIAGGGKRCSMISVSPPCPSKNEG